MEKTDYIKIEKTAFTTSPDFITIIGPFYYQYEWVYEFT